MPSRSLDSSSEAWPRTELIHVRTLGSHLLLDFVQVIEIIGKCRMNIRERNRGHVGDDLVGRHTLVFMPYHDIEYTDTMARDAGLPAADIRRFSNPVLGGPGHDSSILGHDCHEKSLYV